MNVLISDLCGLLKSRFKPNVMMFWGNQIERQQAAIKSKILSSSEIAG